MLVPVTVVGTTQVTWSAQVVFFFVSDYICTSYLEILLAHDWNTGCLKMKILPTSWRYQSCSLECFLVGYKYYVHF